MPPTLSMTRRIAFSSGHRYWFEHQSSEENLHVFGALANRFNHGHNYLLEVTVTGSIDPATGMILNIKILDDLLQEVVVRQFDGKSLNDEIPYFYKAAPCLENLLLYLWDRIAPPEVVSLQSLELAATPRLSARLERGQPNAMTLTRQYEFAASHRLHLPEATHEENLRLFGKCNNPAGHGHNYLLEVTVTGEPDKETGMLVRLEDLDACVGRCVIDRYDHKNLNCDVPELADLNPTSELVAKAIFEQLDGQLPAKLVKIRLHETARSSFEVSGSDD